MRVRPPSETVPVMTLTSSFNRAALNYHAHARVQTAMADWLAQWLPAQRRGSALEIGAGPGVFTRMLLPWQGPLLVTDISSAMCAAGRAALPQTNWRTLAAEVPDGGPWNWIFSSSMLQWTAEPEETFAAWRERLADTGRILAGLFVAETLVELRELTGESGPVIWRTAEAWRDCLAHSGLCIVRDTVERRVFRYNSALALLRSLHGTGTAPVQRVSPGRLRRLLREYDSRHGSYDGVSASWTFYRFEARRAG